MKVLVTGANGKTGKLVVAQLLASGHEVTGLIRKEKQAVQLSAQGVAPLIKDINDPSLSKDLTGTDAVIFAAAGGTGHHREVDHLGVQNLVNASKANNVARFVLISALGAHDPGSWGFTYKAYLQAKADGEIAVRESSLNWTIIRPGSLNSGPPHGFVTLNQDSGGMGGIARADVAAVAVACLEDDHAIGKTFELYDGNTAIKEAVAGL